MSCPDVNRLIDFLGGNQPDPELEAHLSVCPSCRTDLRLLREIPAAFRPELAVPEPLIQRVMADLPLPEAATGAHPASPFQVFGSGLLGTLTAMATIAVTGSGVPGDPSTMILFSLVVGLVVSLANIWTDRKPVPGVRNRL